MVDSTQKFLALDLEFNQPSGKIIQIGISIGANSDLPEQYITKKWYINPGEPIDDSIVNLTGITDNDISLNCVSYQTVATELNSLIKEHNIWCNPVTWGAGDSVSLLSAFTKNNIEFLHFGHRWIDVKTFYTLIMLAKNKKPNGGLSSAMGTFKLPFTGLAHRADVDAFNTLRFFFKFIDRQRVLENILSVSKTL